MSDHRIPTRAESRTFELENLRERARLHAELRATWEEVNALLARLDEAERERDELRAAAQAVVDDGADKATGVVLVETELIQSLAAALDRIAEREEGS